MVVSEPYFNLGAYERALMEDVPRLCWRSGLWAGLTAWKWKGIKWLKRNPWKKTEFTTHRFSRQEILSHVLKARRKINSEGKSGIQQGVIWEKMTIKIWRYVKILSTTILGEVNIGVWYDFKMTKPQRTRERNWQENQSFLRFLSYFGEQWDIHFRVC